MGTRVGFSEFEAKESAVKLNSPAEGDVLSTFVDIGCVGQIGQTLNTRTITKKCEGKIVKNRTKHDGSGELKVSMHIQTSVYKELYGMKSDKLKEGVTGYGSGTHPEFTMVFKAIDEDGNIKFKAFPKCVITDGPSVTINNEDTEVKEIEVTIAVSNDANGFCMYEALESELDEETSGQWMTAFTPDLVKAA